MTPMKSLLLASSALFAAAVIMPAHATPARHLLNVAQAQGDNAVANDKAAEKKKDAQKKGDDANKKDEKEKKKASKQEDDKKNEEKEKRGAPPSKAEAAPQNDSKPPAAAQQKLPLQAEKPAPATAAEKKAPAADEKATPAPKQAAPAAGPEPKQPKQQPAVQQKQPEQKQAEPKQQPAEQEKPSEPATQQAAPAATPSKPAPSQSAEPAPSGKSDAAAATTQQLAPAKPRDSREFIRKDGKQPERTIQDVRQQRRTTQEEGRTVIHEGDRVIVRERNRTFIRHNEDRRFAIGALDVRTDRRNGQTTTVIIRPNGVRIITVTDRDGHLIRRVRRSPDGREVVIIDNRHAGLRGVFIDIRPPRIRMPRHRYIVDADRANRQEIYDLLVAPPVQTIERDYSLAQVRYNAPLREYMRRLDLDIQFETGSWQIAPDQMDRLNVVAAALNRTIARNPREVFLIEGHTDAIGSDEDNLSLSDRRAEAVAVALTEAFQVPAENLVTQGYGEQEMKVETQEASRANRRVALRRITPLINRTAQR
jgi:outer membrane protein OmpA-like peptidoglycan-associated protein